MGHPRPVHIVHRPLDSLTGKLRSFGFQEINHHGVQVGEVDSDGNIISYTRFELFYDKVNGVGKVRLEKKPNVDPNEYKGTGLYGYSRVCDDIKGLTLLSNKEIEVTAKTMISNHGTYRLTTNSCQHFAVRLFNTISDVRGSKRAKLLEEFKEPYREMSYLELQAQSILHPVDMAKHVGKVWKHFLVD